MNKKERVRAALAGRPVDRVPASFWFHFPAESAHGDASVKAHLDYYSRSGVDFLKVMNEHPYQANVTINTPSDWRAVRPAPLSSTFYRAHLDELMRLVDAIGDECLVITTIRNPFSSYGKDTTGKFVTEHLKIDPPPVTQGLAAMAESLALFADACIDAGASGVFYSAKGGDEGRFSVEEFLEYIKPHDLTILNAIDSKGEFNVLHICKDRIRLDLYADYPSHAVNWAVTKHNLSIKEARLLFNRPIIGGMDDRGIVVNGTAEEIQDTVNDVIASAGRDSFILGADCTFPTNVNVQNIRVAVNAAARFEDIKSKSKREHKRAE